MGKRGPNATAKGFEAQGALFDESPIRQLKPETWREDGLSRPERVVRFLETLTITSGSHAGQPFIVRPWQREIIEGIYGPQNDEGRRIVRTALVSMPRKNGKTGLIAGLVLAHLLGPEAEQRGQIYSAAVDRDQAALIFHECVAMIDADPRLAARVNIQSFKRQITDELTGTVYWSLSSDARKAHGLSPSLWIFDELAQVPNRHLLDALQTATGARAEPLGIVISTQAADDNHPMSELVDYAEKVETGIVDDPTFYGRVFAAPDDADPWDEETWFACNPALGDFRSLDEMRAASERAKRLPTFEPAFRNLYLNQRIDAETRFISAVEWNACGDPIDIEALAGRECYGGLDLSASRDLTALVLVFPMDGDTFVVLPFFWLPKDGLREKEDEDRVPYWTWMQSGYLEATPGPTVDYAYVVHRIRELSQLYEIKTIAYDRWRINDLRREFQDEGIDVELSEFGQGYKDFSPAIENFERLMFERRLNHGGHPVLRWNAANAVVTTDPAGNRKLDKNRSRERIDGLVALVMALGVARRFEDQTPSCLTDGPMVLSF